jgi:RNA 3'-terminal phosphate cyclase (ATP)
MKKRGEIVEITIRSFSGGTCPKSVAVSMANGAEAYLKEYYYNMKPQNCGIASSTIRVEEFRDGDIMGSGSGIMIVATTSNGYRLAGSAVGSHKVSPKVSGRQAAVELVNCLSQSYRTNDHEVYYPCVDEYLQDQLILYMALADGVSEIICGSLSLHTQTAISLAEKIFSVHRKVKKKTSDHGEDRTGSSDCQQSPLFEVIRLDGKEENQVPPDDMGYLPGLHLIRCHGIGYGK